MVDDATVTIENINWHPSRASKSSPQFSTARSNRGTGDRFATVHLHRLQPMFGLAASPVIFRPLAGPRCTRFLCVVAHAVPTLANFVTSQHAHGSRDEATHAKAIRNPLARFQRGFESRFENARTAYMGLLDLCMRNRIKVIAGFLAFSILSFGLAPYLGQDFFPAVDGGQIKLHVRAPTGTRIEETTSLTDRIGTAIHSIIPANELDGIVSNIGLSVSGINMAYNNSGTIGVGDADILISLKPNHAPTDGYIKIMRQKLPEQFPGTSFAFLPADIVSQVLNFGVPAPIAQVAGSDLGGGSQIRQCTAGQGSGRSRAPPMRVSSRRFSKLTSLHGPSLTSLAGLTEKTSPPRC